MRTRDRGRSRNLRKGAVPPVLFLTPLSPPLPLEVGPLKQLRSLRECCKLPRGSVADPRTKTNWVHSKVVRKPLLAIILNIIYE